jgi:phosphodiesterase/alkaline phosphatase D-like protein
MVGLVLDKAKPLTDMLEGYFNAYGNPARKDSVDYVLHLGDYIYESAVGVLGRDARATSPNRTLLTLYDYRMSCLTNTKPNQFR